MSRKISVLIAAAVLLLGLSQAKAQSSGSVPIYRITVVARTIPAVSYRTLRGPTEIGFAGTTLMPNAAGKAKVTSRRSATEIQAQFKDLSAPSSFGPEYLTYVLWAITPDGRPINVAEIVPHNGQAKIDVTVNFQAFGLVVTAEPYFAVTRPSDVVVLQNYVTNKTEGKVEEVNARYELLKRGQYVANVSSGEVHPFTMSSKIPLALYEAENAVNIARWSGAEEHAADTFDKAEGLLTQAQDYQARKAGRKPVMMTAREAVQTAADARAIALRNEQQLAQTEQRRLAEQQLAHARKVAEQEAVARANAAAAQAQAEAAKAQAQAQAEQARLAAEQAQARAQRNEQAAQEAENQRLAMRAKLLNQLNAILETRQTPQGLVVTMSHVLFNTSQYTLQQQTRETLAKLAGVLLAYPGLKIRVNGYTDNTGNQQMNQELSEKRADAVRSFLVQEGVPSSSISSQGLGESNPVAPNDTSEGRALNRRVELVVSGNAIGISVGPASG
ncbi:MAG TPA: OmpA family protein [Terriglobia bacterium]|nr:OmpA family protein [Terriglobia bacterium]